MAAFNILLRVEQQASYASELLHSKLTAQLDSRNMGLCTELVLGCLRWQNQLDFAADRFITAKAKQLHGEVRVALRLGCYQILHLTRIPARAAIAESVELVKQSPHSFASGLVNAVLRRVSEIGGAGKLATLRPADMAAEEWSALTVGHPSWLLRRWASDIGWPGALSRAEGNNQPPFTYIRSTGTPDMAALGEALRDEVLSVVPAMLKTCLRIEQGDPARTDLWARGELAIQDQSSQLVPLLLDVRPGQCVLDLCAAPGNKTGLLAQAAGPVGQVIASDLHVHRLKRWSAPRTGVGAAAVHRLALDATQPLPLEKKFDRVLVDAPCSGTGTLQRNPEIKWRLRLENILQLAALQRALLHQAAAAVAPGGRMVYSTCSFEREENQNVVESFLAKHNEFRLMPLRQEAERLRGYLTAPQDPVVMDLLEKNFLATSPDKHHSDGFFATILERNA